MFSKIARDLALRGDDDPLIKAHPFLRDITRKSTFRFKSHSYSHLDQRSRAVKLPRTE